MKINVERSSQFHDETFRQLARARPGAILITFQNHVGHTVEAVKIGAMWYFSAMDQQYTSEYVWRLVKHFHILHHHHYY